MAEAEWMSEDGEQGSAELVTLDAGIALTASDKAQIDIQIATAKKWPRDLKKFQTDALALCASDEDTAGSMFYALPRKSNGKTTYIEGPSVRFAEAIVYCWGNIRIEARVVGIDDTHITAQGTCMDLEKNIGARLEVKRRITDKNGRRYNEDMIVVTGNAASAIAYRNCLFKVVPFALAKKIYDAARKTATGGALPIEARRQNALAWFARVGAPEARVLAQLGVATVDQITEEHILTLTGLKNAIMEGSATVETAFPRAEDTTGGHAGDLNAQARAEMAATKPAATTPPPAEKSTTDEAGKRLAMSRQVFDAEVAKTRPDLGADAGAMEEFLSSAIGAGNIAEFGVSEFNEATKAIAKSKAKTAPAKTAASAGPGKLGDAAHLFEGDDE